MVELLIINRDFPTIGSQLPNHHSKVVANLNDEEMSSNNSTSVYIDRLSPRAKEFDVERFFKGFGKICDINLKQGNGFEEFKDARDADYAVYEMNSHCVVGEPLLSMPREFPGQETITMTRKVTDTGPWRRL